MSIMQESDIEASSDRKLCIAFSYVFNLSQENTNFLNLNNTQINKFLPGFHLRLYFTE